MTSHTDAVFAGLHYCFFSPQSILTTIAVWKRFAHFLSCVDLAMEPGLGDAPTESRSKLAIHTQASDVSQLMSDEGGADQVHHVKILSSGQHVDDGVTVQEMTSVSLLSSSDVVPVHHQHPTTVNSLQLLSGEIKSSPPTSPIDHPHSPSQMIE